MPTGFARENRARRLVTQRLVRPLVVVKAKPAADAPARLDHRTVGLSLAN